MALKNILGFLIKGGKNYKKNIRKKYRILKEPRGQQFCKTVATRIKNTNP